jgi:hypothetical protein
MIWVPQVSEGSVPVRWMASTAYDIPVARLDTAMPWQNTHVVGVNDQFGSFDSRALLFVEHESKS